VAASDGSVHDTGTADPTEEYIERFGLYGSPYESKQNETRQEKERESGPGSTTE
jgi:hypothetical protein